jgi:hypothetical protein
MLIAAFNMQEKVLWNWPPVSISYNFFGISGIPIAVTSVKTYMLIAAFNMLEKDLWNKPLVSIS